ncbi:hypothetical protein CLPU_6c00050 [Gottschalkia purinilytica]|uniref:Uncharacterized protein n=1 Tax=Gottschalkia purinilytica TaxID=1503 RepID=A0A0L0WAI3_GOTPU|nr:hypothetical protein CLPU_6c00050 [Gottschalkia purinilytica]
MEVKEKENNSPKLSIKDILSFVIVPKRQAAILLFGLVLIIFKFLSKKDFNIIMDLIISIIPDIPLFKLKEAFLSLNKFVIFSHFILCTFFVVLLIVESFCFCRHICLSEAFPNYYNIKNKTLLLTTSTFNYFLMFLEINILFISSNDLFESIINDKIYYLFLSSIFIHSLMYLFKLYSFIIEKTTCSEKNLF